MTNLRRFGSFSLEGWSIVLNTLVFGMALAMVLIWLISDFFVVLNLKEGASRHLEQITPNNSGFTTSFPYLVPGNEASFSELDWLFLKCNNDFFNSRFFFSHTHWKGILLQSQRSSQSLFGSTVNYLLIPKFLSLIKFSLHIIDNMKIIYS